MSEYGQQITTGIKYIKVSKTDKEGNNNSQNLQTANKLRINYPDVGVQEYLIQTSQNFADYYLFGVIPNANTSSINEILNYDVEAYKNTSGGPFILSDTPQNFLSVFGNSYTTVSGNTLGYFTGSGDECHTWTLGNTPNLENITLKFSGSVSNSSPTPRIVTFELINQKSSEGIGEPLVTASQIILPGADTLGAGGALELTLSQSNIPLIENESVTFQVRNDSAGSFVAINDLYVILTRSNSPASATETLVTIEPTYDFQFSDYNILNGNIDIARTSRQFLDVDYSTGVLTPTNITTIISGTATPATVQDSNYTLQRHTNPRYGGSRDSSPDFNTVVRTSSTDNPTQPIRTIYQAPENDGSAGK